jgi:hypothetical protein
MLVACRLAGLSALEAHYLGLVLLTQSRAGQAPRSPEMCPMLGPSAPQKAGHKRRSGRTVAGVDGRYRANPVARLWHVTWLEKAGDWQPKASAVERAYHI